MNSKSAEMLLTFKWKLFYLSNDTMSNGIQKELSFFIKKNLKKKKRLLVAITFLLTVKTKYEKLFIMN